MHESLVEKFFTAYTFLTELYLLNLHSYLPFHYCISKSEAAHSVMAHSVY
jgi:hypothetical protein